MNFKLVFTIFAAFAAVQVSAKTVPVADSDSDLLQTISTFLLKLHDTVAAVLTDVENSVADAQSKVTNIQAEVAKVATYIGDQILSFISREVQGLTNSTDATGVQVISCLHTEVDKFQPLLESTLTDIIDCATAQLGDLIGYLKVSVVDVEDAHEKLKIIETSLGNCTSGLAACGLDAANKALTLGTELMTTLKTDSEGAVKIVESLGTTINSCIDTNLLAMEDKNKGLFNEVITCVENIKS